MDRPNRTILLALSALLLPCVAVGWFGVVQITKVEEVLQSSVRQEAEQLLRDTATEAQNVVAEFIRLTCGQVKGESLEAMIAGVQKLAHSERGVDHAFLLDDSLQLLHPRRPPTANALLPFPLRPLRGMRPGEGMRAGELGDHVEIARVFEALGDLDGALLEHDEILKALSRLPQGGRFNPFNVETQIGRVHLSRAALLARLGRFDDAGREIEEIEKMLDSLSQRREAVAPESGIEELQLRCLFLRSRIEPTERTESAVADLLALGSSIAGGDYDEVPDEVLDATLERIGSLVKSNDSSAETAAAWQAILTDEALRVEGRLFASDFDAFGSSVLLMTKRADEATDLMSVDWSAGSDPSLVGVLRVLGPKALKQVWVGVHVDLRALLLERLFSRLRSEDAAFRFEIYTPNDQSLRLSQETVSAAAGADALAEQLLRKPLQGYALRVFARDPMALEARARNLLFGKYALAVGLAVVAVLGAGFLLRAVRREGELSRLKLDFVSRVSHELRTPLALIKMYGDTLGLGRVRDMDKAAEFGGIIGKEADRLTRMIDNVLDFSRIEAGRKVYAPKATDLPALLRSLAEAYRPHLEKKGFALAIHAQPMPPVLVDHEGLTQCFVNLVDNAVKYTDQGAKDLEIAAAVHDGRARVEFRDRGIGIPASECERVFETFYRASTAGERPGAGLGLAIVRHFALAHRGTVTVTARAGGGSVFVLELPLANSTLESPMQENPT